MYLFKRYTSSMYVFWITSSVIICSFIIMLPPCLFRVLFVLYWTLKTYYPQFNFRSCILIRILLYMDKCGNARLHVGLSSRAVTFVISRVVSSPSVNGVTGRDSTRYYSSNSDSGGGKRPSTGPSQTVTQISSTCLPVNWIHLMSLAFLASRRCVCVCVCGSSF